MTARAVHWHEGVFLQPHHFQAEQRYRSEWTHRAVSWLQHANWGIHAIQIDPEALLNSRLVIRHLQILLRDGTPIAIPEDALLPSLDLKNAFTPGQPLTVFLALPMLNLGKSNVASQSNDATSRYKLDSLELEDENTGVNPQAVRVRVPNVRLLLTGDDQTGYETLPICRLAKSAAANAPPELDTTFIPPVLCCEAWEFLRRDIIQASFDRIGRKRQRLAEQFTARGANITSTDPSDLLTLAHLRELNEAYAVLSLLAFTPGIPPWNAYLELCRIVGQLLIFDRSGKWPALPPYDHDDVGTCFHRVKVYLDTLLDILPDPEYKERPFVGMGTRLQVAVESAWLEPIWNLYIGVRSDNDPEEAVRLLTVPGQLDMKVGSGDRVDNIFQMGLAGLTFEPCPRPSLLPDQAGLRYFRLNRSPEKEWAFVLRALSIAIRINETRIVGGFSGQRAINVRSAAGHLVSMQFTLFAVPNS